MFRLAGTSAHLVCSDVPQTAVPVIDVSYGGIALMVEDPEAFPAAFDAVLHIPIQPPLSVSLRKSNTQCVEGTGTRVGCCFVR